MSKAFQFKEFTVAQNRCAMKIGTDGVLLGAWAKLNHEFSILDIGTGTGVIALMLAQRSNAEVIDAIEIEDNAYEQAVDNFENSNWADRLYCYHASLQEFAEEIEDKYELIISNPPFYSDNHKSGNLERNLARFEDSLPFEHLLSGVSSLLEKQGNFFTIVPFKEEEKLIAIAKENGLFLQNVCRVKGNEQSEIKRSLLQFSFKEVSPTFESLTIEIERHIYTDAYINLVKDFYLKM